MISREKKERIGNNVKKGLCGNEMALEFCGKILTKKQETNPMRFSNTVNKYEKCKF